MAEIFGGYSNDWYPKEKPIIPRAYHKYLKSDDLKIQYPEIFAKKDSTLQDIIDSVSNGSIVRLDKDYTEDIVIKSGRVVYIDLAGHKLTNKASDTITVEFGGALFLFGKGTVDNVTGSMAPIYNSGIAAITGPTITHSAGEYYAILNHGVMVISGSTTCILGEDSKSSVIANGYYDYTNASPKSGYVEGTNFANPTLTIEDGTFTGGRNSVKIDDGGKAVIKGGKFHSGQCEVLCCNECKISGGQFLGSEHLGEKSEKWNSACFGISANYYSDTTDVGRVTITGGTIYGAIGVSPKASIRATGGKFQFKANVIPSGYHWEKEGSMFVVAYGAAPEEVPEDTKSVSEQ